MRLDFHIEAVEEYEREVDYYTQVSPHVAARFIEEIESRIELIKESPDRWKRVGRKARVVFAHTFPFQVVYIAGIERIEVIAIMHQSRMPKYWLHRIS